MRLEEHLGRPRQHRYQQLWLNVENGPRKACPYIFDEILDKRPSRRQSLPAQAS